MAHTVIHVVDGQLRLYQEASLTLQVMQSFVGGYIERAAHVPSTPGRTIDIWCHDEGHLLGLPIRVVLMAGRLEPDGYPMAGALLIAASNDAGESIGLTDAEVARIVMTPSRNLRTVDLVDDQVHWLRVMELSITDDPVNAMRANGELEQYRM